MSVSRLLDGLLKRRPMSVLQKNSLRYKLAVFSGVVSPLQINGQPPSTVHMDHNLRHYPDLLGLEPCCQNVPSSLTDETIEREGDLLGWDGVLWGVPKETEVDDPQVSQAKASQQPKVLRGQIEETLRVTKGNRTRGIIIILLLLSLCSKLEYLINRR